MSTMIKDKSTGTWVTVAGGYRMWVGTKAALQAGIAAGKIPNGTAAMVTDDYENNSVAIAHAINMFGYPLVSNLLCRNGKVVTFTGRWNQEDLPAPIQINGGTSWLKLPYGFRPVDSHLLPLGMEYDSDAIKTIQFYTDVDTIKNGNVVGLTTRLDAYLQASWITADDWPSN